jgi:hypothetical protein
VKQKKSIVVAVILDTADQRRSKIFHVDQGALVFDAVKWN